eukprot:2000945-Prymnesium_polylepis.3
MEEISPQLGALLLDGQHCHAERRDARRLRGGQHGSERGGVRIQAVAQPMCQRGVVAQVGRVDAVVTYGLAVCIVHEQDGPCAALPQHWCVPRDECRNRRVTCGLARGP